MITLPSGEGTQYSLRFVATLAAQTDQAASRFTSLHDGNDIEGLGSILENTKSLYSLLCKLNIQFGNDPLSSLFLFCFTDGGLGNDPPSELQDCVHILQRLKAWLENANSTVTKHKDFEAKKQKLSHFVQEVQFYTSKLVRHLDSLE